MTADDPGDYIAPENKARVRIDDMLTRAGWVVQDYKSVNLYAGEGVAVRELVTAAGPADYVLFVNRQAVGVIEAKKQGTTLAGVEWQTVKYQSNIPDELPGPPHRGWPSPVRLRVDRRRDLVHLPLRSRADRTPGVLVPSPEHARRHDRGPRRGSRRARCAHASTTSNRSHRRSRRRGCATPSTRRSRTSNSHSRTTSPAP